MALQVLVNTRFCMPTLLQHLCGPNAMVVQPLKPGSVCLLIKQSSACTFVPFQPKWRMK
jgi:hypothetical protein